MTSSVGAFGGGGSTRRRGLADIIPHYDDSQSDKSQISVGSTDSDQKSNHSGIKIQHLTGVAASGRSRFPKLEECAHFHYEYVELNSLQMSLYEEDDLKSLSSLEYNENTENKWLTVKICSQGQSWLLRRTYENFRMLDHQLHQCIYDRKFSALPELPPLENLPEKQDPQSYIKCQLSRYCERFSDIAGNLINCGPVLNWLQLDNRGRRILVTDGDNCPINTPAVAAAYAVRKYTAVAADEISFDVGDMISVIDMPPPEDSIWWRGKRGFMVGFFPSQCVAVITDKVPRNLQLNQPSSMIEPSKPVLRKHGKLIAFFRAFILSRPSKRHLKQSGIFKERVFGCDLGEHLLNSGQKVPMVLKCCSEFIEQRGIVDGIYRLSGASSNIQKLRTTFDEDRIPAIYHDDSILQDIHSVASLLKMYFRELPNPLCTYQLYKNFVNAVQNTDPVERVAEMREVVQKLPPPHFRTLEFLMKHLSKVAEHGGRTGMTARNIAIVWAPNLLRCKELEYGGVAALQGVGVQAVVTEFLISNVDLVFCNEQAPNEGISRRIRPKSLSLGTPTKLLSLEEAQSKRLGSEHTQDNYIEVGGGPACLPKMYHTVIELPTRKRLPLKRSPLGWKSFFSRNSSTSLRKSCSSTASSTKRKTSTSTEISYKIEDTAKKPMPEAKSRLRTVKSAESLSSNVNGGGTSARNSMCLEYTSPPSPRTTNPGHSRSVSHDSYFDHLAESTPIRSCLRQDVEGLSELQVNFDLDESEMKIFSEDSSQLFSNTSSSEHLQTNLKKIPLLASAENTIIVDPSPKRHKTSDNSSCSSVTLSDDMTAVSNKRSRLEERLFINDFAFIDSHSHDRLVVEVDVHHRASSQLASPMLDTVNSENDTVSDSTLANASVSYTPLSECTSFTTMSNREPSYQRLTSSMSSSQFALPRSSSENVNRKQFENTPRNRFSYHGELRPSSMVVPVVNRLSLQTLSSSKGGGGGGDGSATDGSSIESNGPPPSKRNEVDTTSSGSEEKYATDKRKWKNEKKLNTIEWATKDSNCSNGRQLKLILNDKEMFSDGETSTTTTAESPYELVSMVGNRMTPVLDRSSFFENEARSKAESNYEEIEPAGSVTRRSVSESLPFFGQMRENVTDGNYEEMDKAIYNYAAAGDDYSSGQSEKKSNYEEIYMAGDHRTSNESLASSCCSAEDEAMIENHLYESLATTDDSSPDPANANRQSNTDRGKEANDNEKLAFSSTAAERRSLHDQSPLLSDTQSSYSDSEHSQQIYINTQLGKRTDNEQIFGTEKRVAKNDDVVYRKKSSPVTRPTALDLSPATTTDKRPHSTSPMKIGSTPTPKTDCDKRFDNGIKEDDDDDGDDGGEKKKNDLLRSGSAKSVQDLVSKFEWSADSDTNVRKCSISSSSSKCKIPRVEEAEEANKKDYFSLPAVLVGPPLPVTSPDEKADSDESIRRDRIEKYKKERRMALRQKYNVDDKCNDEKDEEMIRRFKQKILKNEQQGGPSPIDSSPTNVEQPRKRLSECKESPTKSFPAVTTISILYTSRKKKEEADNEDEPHSQSNSNLEKLNEPCENISIGDRIANMSKSSSNVNDRLKETSNAVTADKRPFTASLERKTCKLRSFVREESLVAKRVNQLSEASSDLTSTYRKSSEPGLMRQRAHSTSGPVVPYCIRDIAAIFENKDNK